MQAIPISRPASLMLPPANDAPVAGPELSRLVDQSPLAIFLVNAQSRILYANRRAGQLLAQGGVVQCVSGKLVLTASGAPRLCDMLAQIAGQTAVEATPTRVALKAANGSLWLAQVGGCDGAQHKASFAVLLSEAVVDLDSAATLVADAFALTQAERRALPALLRLGRARQVAQSFGVSVTTVRTHLKNIYAKTATKTRNDLFKLVARFAMVGCL